MHEAIKLTEKYERNGWPSLTRPDLKAPSGWSLSLITAVDRVRSHRLSPDGTRIAFIWDRADLSDVYVMDSAGGWPARISTNRELAAYWSDEVPRWSPDSRRLAFCMDGHVHVADAAGGEPRKISDFSESASGPVWMPDSRRLIINVVRHERDQLLVTDRNGAYPQPLATGPYDYWTPAPSPDGKFVACERRHLDDLNRIDLMLIDAESGEQRLLCGQAGEKNSGAVWSPDGSTIAFRSERAGWGDLWLVRADGEGLRRLTSLNHEMFQPAWSPDGTRIACVVNLEGTLALAIISVSDGDVRYLRQMRGSYSAPQWTPDGAALIVAFESPVAPPDLWRVDAADGRGTQITFSQLPALATNALVTPERVRYTSFDGREIPAYLYRPARPNGAAVLYPHGGPSSQYVDEWDILAQYFVAKGYTWLAPNYRGSTGYGIEFEHANHFDWGKGDLQDCLAGADYLAGLDWIDPTRRAIYGGSYGGYLTALALSRDPAYRFACGIAKYGDMQLTSSWAQCNRHLRLYVESFLGHPATHGQVYVDGSSIYQVEQVQKPVLILHGLKDDVVAPEASEEWVEALRKHDKVFEYKTYAIEPHGFLHRATQLDAWSRMERFLDWYLMVGNNEE
ncbi:MAG: S9 family peptidase [Caldilineaceae bacterium]|nr:S9 family peptidase [Caldilineaceae bacterium]